MKRFGFILFLLLLIPAVGATQIADETTRIVVQPDERANVTVERTYASITSPKISYFVPAQYSPTQLVAKDALGEMDCTVREFDSGKEILCDPRGQQDYVVTVTFFADFVDHDRRSGTYTFSYVKQVLTPTRETNLHVTLPEGYGLVRSRNDPSYAPAFAEVGSEGRRIFLQWTRDDVSIGDTTQYTIQFEELQVLDRVPVNMLAGIITGLLFLSGAVLYYLRGRNDNPETIAAIFPVLKEDEQEVMRYIIEQDGEVEQRDIVEHVSYSKAKISKLLSDLEERNLVEKEKQGRVNVVRLAKEVGELKTTSTT